MLYSQNMEQLVNKGLDCFQSIISIDISRLDILGLTNNSHSHITKVSSTNFASGFFDVCISGVIAMCGAFHSQSCRQIELKMVFEYHKQYLVSLNRFSVFVSKEYCCASCFYLSICIAKGVLQS